MHRLAIPVALAAVLAVTLLVWFEDDPVDHPPLPARAEVAPLPPIVDTLTEPAPTKDASDEDKVLQPDLVLLATTVSPSVPERSRAHIHDRTSKVRYVLAPGQMLSGYDKLELVEVGDGSAILDHAGQRLELFLDMDLSWPEDPSMRPPPVAASELLSMLKGIQVGESEDDFLRRYEHGLGMLYRMDLGLRTNEALFKHGVFAPAKEDGRQIGYSATRINSGSFWDTLGLEVGDVILEVNGIPIEGPESNRDAVKEVMRSETKIQLMIRRDDDLFETSSLTLPVASGVWSDDTAVALGEE